MPCASPGFLSRSASTGESRALNPGTWDSEGSARIQKVLRMLPVDLLPALPTCAGRDFPQGPANVKRRDRAQSPRLCGENDQAAADVPLRGGRARLWEETPREGPGAHPALLCGTWGHGQLQPELTRWTASPSRAGEEQLWTEDRNHRPVVGGLAWGRGCSPPLRIQAS